jgi:hypothetical protein
MSCGVFIFGASLAISRPAPDMTVRCQRAWPTRPRRPQTARSSRV